MLLYKDIVKEPNPVLRKKCVDVSLPLDSQTLQSLWEMSLYLENSYNEEFVTNNDIRPGVGIAAPQIGLDKKMLCMACYDEHGEFHSYCMINPTIISHSIERTYLESGEGCLSVEKDYKGYIHRYKRVKVETYLYDFETQSCVKKTLSLKGYVAVVFQHEYDHLSGILFYDHINKENPFLVIDNSTPIMFN